MRAEEATEADGMLNDVWGNRTEVSWRDRDNDPVDLKSVVLPGDRDNESERLTNDDDDDDYESRRSVI